MCPRTGLASDFEWETPFYDPLTTEMSPTNPGESEIAPTQTCSHCSLRKRTAPPTHNNHWPYPSSRNVHIFAAATVDMQTEVAVHIIVKALVELVHAVAGCERVSTTLEEGTGGRPMHCAFTHEYHGFATRGPLHPPLSTLLQSA